MEIKQIQLKKAILEKDIEKLLTEFEIETELSINSMNFVSERLAVATNSGFVSSVTSNQVNISIIL